MTMRTGLTLERFLPYRLAYTSNLVSEAVAHTYKALFGLTIPEWRLIAHTAEDEGVTQQDVVLRSQMDKVTVSRAAIALAARGLIRRQPSATDKRAQTLSLTETGEQLYAEVAPKALELQEAIFHDFSAEERDALTALLRRVDAAVLKGSPAPGGRGAR